MSPQGLAAIQELPLDAQAQRLLTLAFGDDS